MPATPAMSSRRSLSRAARLERMDEILLLEQGRVVRRGTPAEMADALQRLVSA